MGANWTRGHCPRGCGKIVSVNQAGRAPRHVCAPPKMGRSRPRWICYRGLHTSRAAKEPRKCRVCSDTVYAFDDWQAGKHLPPKTEAQKAADRVKLEQEKAKIRAALGWRP